MSTFTKRHRNFIVVLCFLLFMSIIWQYSPSYDSYPTYEEIKTAAWISYDFGITYNTLLHPVKKIEVVPTGGIDYVFAAYDEPPEDLYKELEQCITKKDRVFVYLKISSNRTHSMRKKGIKQLFQARTVTPNNISSWTNVSTSFRKEINLMTVAPKMDEFPGFLLHIINHYDDMNPYTVFLHAHTTSWHSNKICGIVSTGLSNIRKSHYGFQNINYYYTRRCASLKTPG